MIRRIASSLNVNFDDLNYRGEGNNTIVLSDQKNGVIFRFRKTSVSTSDEEVERKKLKTPKCLSESYNFIQHVIRHTLGSEFVIAMQMLEVPSDVLQRIDERLKPERPSCRLKKAIDTSYRNVLRAPDACWMPQAFRQYGTGPTVCVEVKPKNGFIHNTRHVTNRLERTTCKFCMVQYHEKKTTMWQARSSYCPCDIFSGQRRRMRRAIKALLRNPQINFRCFLDGRLHYSCCHEMEPFKEFLSSFLDSKSENEAVDEFVDLLIDGLLYEFRQTQSQTWRTDTEYSLTCHESIRKAYEDDELVIDDGDGVTQTKLPVDSVLGRIFALQLRDSLGSRGIQPHLTRLNKHFEAIGISWRWPMPSDTDHRARLREWKLDSPELLDSFQRVEDYLIALVANDCSMMVTMQEAKPNAPSHLPTLTTRRGLKLLLNVVVVDLDPKSFGKVSETALSWNDEIVAAFRAHRPPTPASIRPLLHLPPLTCSSPVDTPLQGMAKTSSSSSPCGSLTVSSSPSSSDSHSSSPAVPPCSPSLPRPV